MEEELAKWLDLRWEFALKNNNDNIYYQGAIDAFYRCGYIVESQDLGDMKVKHVVYKVVV